jgi:hypothetical protein
MQCNMEFGYQLSICSGTNEKKMLSVYNLDKHQTMYKTCYICNCDSLIIGEFGRSLYFVKKKIGCYTRLVAHPITKVFFYSLILLFFLPSHLPTQISTGHQICHFHNKYNTPVQSVHIKRRNTSFYHTTHTFHHTTFTL